MALLGRAAAGRPAPLDPRAPTVGEIGSGGMPGGSEPEQHAGGHRHARGECEDAQVDPEGGEARNVERGQCRQGSEQPARRQQPGGASRRGQHEALGQELPHDPPAAGPESRSHRHLPLARFRAGQEHVRDVRACHQQHERHHSHQHEQRGPQLDGAPTARTKGSGTGTRAASPRPRRRARRRAGWRDPRSPNRSRNNGPRGDGSRRRLVSSGPRDAASAVSGLSQHREESIGDGATADLLGSFRSAQHVQVRSPDGHVLERADQSCCPSMERPRPRCDDSRRSGNLGQFSLCPLTGVISVA